MNFSRFVLPKRRLLANVTRELYVQFLLNVTRRVEIVTSPRFTCTDTRPLQPTLFVMALGSDSVPRVLKENGARISRGVTVALSLPMRRPGLAGVGEVAAAGRGVASGAATAGAGAAAAACAAAGAGVTLRTVRAGEP